MAVVFAVAHKKGRLDTPYRCRRSIYSREGGPRMADHHKKNNHPLARGWSQFEFVAELFPMDQRGHSKMLGSYNSLPTPPDSLLASTSNGEFNQHTLATVL